MTLLLASACTRTGNTDGTHYTPGKTEAHQASACSTAAPLPAGCDTSLQEARPIARRKPDRVVRAIRGSAFCITTQGLRLSASAQSVKHSATYTLTALTAPELPPLPQGMVNMTASAAGYRLLPSGDHFSPAAELRVAYNPDSLPQGYTPDDIYTSYYDTEAMAWVRLERVGVDTASHEIVSLTTHFTDFVNELLKAPEMPETQAFVPTMMSDLEAANPIEGVTLIQPPSANSDGTVALSYPLTIPDGRGGMQPSLALTYNSEGSNGWLGVGWDIPVPAISVDTRWGVPRYSTAKESEVYLYKGEQLVALDDDGNYLPLPHRTSTWSNRFSDGARFVPRVNEDFDSIVRHGTLPSDYWWEVYDRTGTVHRYGHYATRNNNSNQSTLRDDHGNIARWCLAESEDMYGNMVLYLYDTVHDPGIPASNVDGRQIYLAEIHYTLHRDTLLGTVDDTGFHRIVFVREDNDLARRHGIRYQDQDNPSASSYPQRIPAVISGRAGFKEVTASLLSHIQIHNGDTLSKIWYFGMEYGSGSGFKTRLSNIFVRPVPEYTGPTEEFQNFQEYNDYYMDYFGEKGVFYRGEHTVNIIRIDYYDAPDDLFGSDIDLGDVWSAHTGTLFPYGGDVHTTGMALTPVGTFAGTLSTSALGSTRGSSWNLGGGLDVGVGFNVFWTELAAGGQYDYTGSEDKGYISMTDIDGDGLPDKVFKNIIGGIYYRKHVAHGDGTFHFASPKPLMIRDFLVTRGSSHNVGLQVALGVHASASKNVNLSTTETFFADVNADGLPDIVTDEGVLFNDLVDGVPTFRKAPRHGDPTVADTIVTSTMPCGYVIYDGEVNDSLYCETVVDSLWIRCTNCTPSERQYAITNSFLNNGYSVTAFSGDSILGCRYRVDCERRFSTSTAWPETEAVKVWVAPDGGTVVVTDSIRMLPDRTGRVARSRIVDGVAYSVQHEHGVVPRGDNLSSSTSTVIQSLCGTLAPDDTTFTVSTATLQVARGDVIMFRLQSGDDRSYDRTDWRHAVRYTNRPGTDPYGLPNSTFLSTHDFVVAGSDIFSAPERGTVTVDIDIATGSASNRVAVGAMAGFLSLATDTVASAQNTTLHVRMNNSTVIPVDTGDPVAVLLYSAGTTDFGMVQCSPHIIFTPEANSTISTPVDYYPSAQLLIADGQNLDSVYYRLFGPLYRGWGQFGYLSDGTDAGDPIELGNLVYNLGGFTAADTHQMSSVGDQIDIESFSFDELSQAVTATSNYNPLSSAGSRWHRMDADSRRQMWTGFGRNTAIMRYMTSNTLPAEFYSSCETTVAIEPECPVPASTAAYPKVKTHARQNETVTFNLAGNAANIYGNSRSWSTSTMLSEYLDLNGDRYPDLLYKGNVQYTMPYGGLSPHVSSLAADISVTGTASTSNNMTYGSRGQFPHPMFGKTQRTAKISAEPKHPSDSDSGNGSGGLGGVSGDDTARCNYVDINGDGLPDRVYDDGQVMLNIGYSFLPKEPWSCGPMHKGTYDSYSASASFSEEAANFAQGVTPPSAFSMANFSIGGGYGIGLSNNHTKYQLMDVNGDGLPDKIVNNANNITVYINVGNGNWEKITTDVPQISHGMGFNENVSVSATLGATWGLAKITGTLSGSPLSRSFSCDKMQLMDIDGDGLPDYVTSSLESDMHMRRNLCGKTNLLKSVTNEFDGTFAVDYSFVAPSYDHPQGKWVLTSCIVTGDTTRGIPDSKSTFSYRNPRYDRYERTSYGFDTVVTCQDTCSATGTYTHYRYLTEGYDNRSYHRRGKKLSQSVSDAGHHRWDETLYDVAVFDLENGEPAGDGDCPLVSYPLIEKTVTNHYEGNTTPRQTTAVGFRYDSRRNIVRYTNWGDTNRTGDEVCAVMQYLDGQQRNLIALRSSVDVHGGSQPTAALMRHAEFTYNGRGSLLSRTDRIAADGTSAETRYHYDRYGNPDSVILPPNDSGQRMHYAYTYDPVLHRLPVRVDDAYGRTSHATYSYRYAKPLTVTDVAGSTVRYTYDSLGRTTSVTAPDELAHGLPYTWRAKYFNLAAITLHYDRFNPADPIRTVTLGDDWGRVVQVKKDICVEGQPAVQLSGRVEYDALGRAVKVYDPVADATGGTLAYNTARGALRSVSQYDILDRNVKSTTYDSNIILVQTCSYAYTPSGTGAMLSTTVTDPRGHSTTSITDAYGRTAAVTDALGGTTTMTYDALGQLVASFDPEGFQTLYVYDMLGRPVSRSHPDAGTTLTQYDKAGNVTLQTNAAGETVTTLYHYLRPTERQYSKIPHNNVQYSYNAYGQLSVVQDGSGRSVFYYDAMGNVSKNVRTFAVPFSHKTFTFTMEFEYDSWGRACAITYPDGERVSYAYDCGGSLLSMRGTKGSTARNYIDRVSYNIYGQRSRIEYGNGTRAEYRYDDLRRLSRLKTYAVQGGSRVAVQDIVYRFDSVGNIVLDSNSAAACGGIGGQYVNRYRYDAISRLVGATQSNTYSSGNVLSAAYSPSGRLCSKQQTFTGQNSAFGYDGSNRPHAPRRLFDSGLHRLHDLQWDDMGNLAQVNSYLTDAESGADYEGSRHLFWTEDNRMVNAVDDKYFSYYAYDHSGERVLKMTGKNTLLDINADRVHTSSYVDRITLYTSPYLVADDNGYTKHYYAGTERVCAVIGNGGLNNLGNFIGPDPHMQNTANNLYEKCISVMQDRQLRQNESDAVKACGQDADGLDIDLMPVPASVLQESAVKTTTFENAMNANSQLSQQGEIAYFYHGDHLGSASWITDANGIPVQHLQYLPFGETFVDQHTAGYEERFTFTGKEKDSETGFYYFGARYYDPSISGLFLSIDPMADKYPSISPYAYCAWNPVKLVDPDGRDLYIPNEDSESHNASKQDILSLVKEKYKKYICFDKEGNVSLSEDVTDGMLKNDKGLALIKDLVTSQKKFLYEASDDASSTYNDGLSHEMTSDEWTMDGIVNASSYGKDSRGLYTHTPKKGYDGHVILAKSGDWKETDKNGFATSIRKSVLFHELAENYYRTNNNMDYKEAHNEAVAREGFVFKRNFPGTIPRMSRSNPKDGFYYKGEHIF